MGYVQTFNFRPGSAAYTAAWPDLYRDTAIILDKIAGLGIVLRGPDGTGTPRLDPATGIGFNGDASTGKSLDGFDLPAPHHMPGTPADCRFWRFIKTEGLPYDVAICAILLRAHLLTPATFLIGGSGTWEEDWIEPPEFNPRDIVADLFGIQVERNPLTDPSDGMAVGPGGWTDPRLVDSPVIP